MLSPCQKGKLSVTSVCITLNSLTSLSTNNTLNCKSDFHFTNEAGCSINICFLHSKHGMFFWRKSIANKTVSIDAIYISGREYLFCSEWAYTSSVAVLLVLFITSVATKTIHQQKFRNILIGQPNISIESRTVFMQRTKCIYESKQNPAFLYCFRSELSFSPLYTAGHCSSERNHFACFSCIPEKTIWSYWTRQDYI